MLKPFLIVPALFLMAAPALPAQQAPTTPAAPGTTVVPAEYVGKPNPVKPTADLQARAKKVYGWDCAMCHGDNGDGKGDMAADQKLTVRDFRAPDSLAHMSDGEIFYIIQKGQGKMPPEGDRANPDLIWNMVVYLRKMSGTPPTPGGAEQ